MTNRAHLTPRDMDLLSAYLDGSLTEREKNNLEGRLSGDDDLRVTLEELRAVRDGLRALPILRSPRALTLSPAMAGCEAPRSKPAWPMALGSALAALAFLLLFSRSFIGGGLRAASAVPAAQEAAPMLFLGGGAPAEDSVGGNGAAATSAAGMTPTIAFAFSLKSFPEELPATATPAPLSEEMVHSDTGSGIAPLPHGGSADELVEPSLSFPPLEDVVNYVEILLVAASILLGFLAIKRSRRKS